MYIIKIFSFNGDSEMRKATIAYISHNKKYRYFIHRNRSVFCKFIDEKRYRSYDFGADKNRYAHLKKS